MKGKKRALRLLQQWHDQAQDNEYLARLFSDGFMTFVVGEIECGGPPDIHGELQAARQQWDKLSIALGELNGKYSPQLMESLRLTGKVFELTAEIDRLQVNDERWAAAYESEVNRLKALLWDAHVREEERDE